LKLVIEMKLSVMCLSFNDVKDSDKNMRTLQLIKECIATCIANMHELVAKNHQMTLTVIEDQLHINRETFLQIRLKRLGKRKICIQLFLHRLMEEQQKHRVII
jgi:hypothetical protein